MSTSNIKTDIAPRASAIVASYVRGAANTTQAGQAALADFAATLKGLGPISDEHWKASYAATVKSDLTKAGISEASMGFTVSKIKKVAQAITSGTATGDHTFSSFYVSLTPKGAKEGGNGADDKAPKSESATANPAQYVADGFEDDAKGRKAAKALCEQLGGAEMAMALMIVTDQSVSLAGIVRDLVANHEPALRQLSATLHAEGAPKSKRVLRD